MKDDKNKAVDDWRLMMCREQLCLFIPHSYGCIGCLYDVGGIDINENTLT